MKFKRLKSQASCMAETEIHLNRAQLKKLVSDNEASAAAVDLLYVTDSDPGIERIRKNDDFVYMWKGMEVKDAAILDRIRRLVIPPAWTQVWICSDEKGHLQATGRDARNRKQYKYHPFWTALRNQTKYVHLHDFGRALPGIREQLKHHLAKHGLPQEKVLAAVISLMQCTCMRVGNSVYEKLNGSFGLTTLKDRHVKIQGQRLQFSFKGKKGIYHNIQLKSKRLSRIVKACRDIPGKELFQYYDEDGKRQSIDSGMVNDYIRNISGGNFTAKDFRTWEGTLHALAAFKNDNPATTETEKKKRIVAVLDSVARHLGNTRSVCKKYYVHPAIMDLYSSGGLQKYFLSEANDDCGKMTASLSEEETILMAILVSYRKRVVL